MRLLQRFWQQSCQFYKFFFFGQGEWAGIWKMLFSVQVQIHQGNPKTLQKAPPCQTQWKLSRSRRSGPASQLHLKMATWATPGWLPWGFKAVTLTQWTPVVSGKYERLKWDEWRQATMAKGMKSERFPSADIMVNRMWSIFCLVLDVWDPLNHKVPKD